VMVDGRVFHHTPFIRHAAQSPWCALEYATVDKKRAVAAIFRTGDAGDGLYHFTPRGLDLSRMYAVTFDNRNQAIAVSGLDLQQHGIKVQLEAPLSSEMLLFQAVE
jgi:Glycosyl hydrolase family 36 C-terminal domain